MSRFIDDLNPAKNLPSSLVVFFVAVPLCLGIALASGAPLLAGLIAGILGGIVTGALSGSPLSVSGPAAGLSSIVLVAINQVGSFEVFLVAVVLAGLIQIALGYLKAGNLGYLFPSSVIKGMLAGIGVILILKQIPHALGDDRDYEGDESFLQPDQKNTISELLDSIMNFSPGSLLICLVCIGLLILWQSRIIRKSLTLSLIPGPVLAVAAGVAIQSGYTRWFPEWAIGAEHMVDLPDFATTGIIESFHFPDWSGFENHNVYLIALTLALVASLETLLSIDASDKMDPHRRKTPLNRELKAQGVTNLLSGLIGGLPVTSVIVRTSANVNAGAASKFSTIAHGILLAIAVFLLPDALEMIPLSALAAILLVTGFKLSSPDLWREQWNKGMDQFIPFIVTLVIIVFSNLLLGVFIGLMVALYFVLKTNHQSALIKVHQGNQYLIKFTKDASFLNKSNLVRELSSIPAGSSVLIEGGTVQFFDNDILETLDDFLKSSSTRKIQVEIRRTHNALHHYFKLK